MELTADRNGIEGELKLKVQQNKEFVETIKTLRKSIQSLQNKLQESEDSHKNSTKENNDKLSKVSISINQEREEPKHDLAKDRSLAQRLMESEKLVNALKKSNNQLKAEFFVSLHFINSLFIHLIEGISESPFNL